MNTWISSLFSAILLTVALPVTSEAAPVNKSGKNQEISVTLFGQPCTMSGPFPRPSLALLHEISPEKISPDLTLAQMKRIRTKAGDIKGMPMVIEQYRDHLRKRLSAKIAFEEAIDQAKNTRPEDAGKTLDHFLKNSKEHISPIRYPDFEAAAKKMLQTTGVWNSAFIGPLRERYEDVIQPDTEEEFHKAIRIAKIQYVCVFDDADPRGDDSEE